MDQSIEQVSMIEGEKVKCSKWLNDLSIVRVICVIIILSGIILIGIGKIEFKLSVIHKFHSYGNLTNDFKELNLSRNSSNNQNLFIYGNRFDVVLSYYTEDVNYVSRYIGYLRDILIPKNVTIRIIVYNKNAKANLTYLKEVLKADVVILLDNFGREGATFLHHIISNYDKLGDHILFSQAGVEGLANNGLSDWFLHRLSVQFNSSVGYMPLVVNDMISIYDCGQHPSGHFQRLVDLWGMLQQTLCPLGGQAVAFRGQFLVSSRRIRNRSLQIYKYIYEIITADNAHWIHHDPRSPNWGSSPDNPIFGHVVERLWTVLFNCTKPDLLERCKRNDCACFD